MAGDARLQELVEFLARLTGEPLTADQPLQLRSVQRAALSSWARKQNLPLHLKAASTKANFTVRELLSGDAATEAPKPKSDLTPTPMPTAILGGLAGIGIDIEEIAALPAADDYREHAFYQDNFTPAEIAHCIRQPDVRASLCGLWAAKEAVLKCGLAEITGSDRLGTIEIHHDSRGRPSIQGGQLSISHSATSAVAVCIAMAVAPASITETNSVRPAADQTAPVAAPPRPNSRRKVAALASLGLMALSGIFSRGRIHSLSS